jgi:RNA polymerase-binding transcription factor DksA
MEKDDIAHYSALLIEEKKLLERELGTIGEKSSEGIDGWEASLLEVSTETAELEGRASEITEFEDRNAVENELAHRLHAVTLALEQITQETYGICRICGVIIEKARLNANPAANTCKIHREG